MSPAIWRSSNSRVVVWRATEADRDRTHALSVAIRRFSGSTEPLSRLGVTPHVDMLTEIRKLHQRPGATSVYVTHDRIAARTAATRIVVMKGNVLLHTQYLRRVYNAPTNTCVSTFMGSPSMSLIAAQIGRKDDALHLFVGIGADAIDMALSCSVALKINVLEPTGERYGATPGSVEARAVRCRHGNAHSLKRLQSRHFEYLRMR